MKIKTQKKKTSFSNLYSEIYKIKNRICAEKTISLTIYLIYISVGASASERDEELIVDALVSRLWRLPDEQKVMRHDGDACESADCRHADCQHFAEEFPAVLAVARARVFILN